MSTESPLSDSERALKETLLRAGRATRPSDEARRRALAASLVLVASTPSKAAATLSLARLLGAGRWVGLATLGVAAVGVTVALTHPWASPGHRAGEAATPAPGRPGAGVATSSSADRAPASSYGTPIYTGASPGSPEGVTGSGSVLAPLPVAPPASIAPLRSSAGPLPTPGAGVGLLAPPSPGAAAVAAVASPEREEAPPASPPASASAAPVRPSLGEEMAVIDEARRSLAAGDTPGALGALDRYARTFPAGRFGQEATFLRIDALLRRGDRAGALALARGFLASHPGSPLADRVRKLTGLEEGPPPSPP